MSLVMQDFTPFHNYNAQKSKQIFCCVFLFALILQYLKISTYLTDHEMWANQIKYFLNNDRRLFDFYLAYGHPGTTLVSLGCLFHILFKLSYGTSLTVAMSLIIAFLTASSSLLCYLLQPRSLWWFTTAFVLTVSRFYVLATPPTATVMSFIVLLVLATCWIFARNHSAPRHFIYWGILLGFSAATRLDVTLFVGLPLLLLLSFRKGISATVMIILGGGGAFIIGDPFLWFMPKQHVIDLLSKFTLHYSEYSSQTLSLFDHLHGFPLAGAAMILFLYDYVRGQAVYLTQPKILLVFLGVTLLAIALLLTSRFQSMRYLYPLLIVWEIYFPLFVLSRHGPCQLWGKLDRGTVRIVMGFVIPTQLLGYLFMFGG